MQRPEGQGTANGPKEKRGASLAIRSTLKLTLTMDSLGT